MITKRFMNLALCGASVSLLMSANAIAGNCSSAKADIVNTAATAGDFQTLVAAIKAADLVETLRSPGPFTVFAPTDDAFAKLPAGTLNSLLEDPDRLGAILKYHVVPENVWASDVAKLSSVKTALGQTLAISTGRSVKINDANVIKTDIEASNGVIHVIDSVLLPKNDIVETARGTGSFKTLLTALEAAGLTEALRGDGPFTVFAPTDEAFAKLPPGTVESLLRDPPKLQAVLTYHVIPGRILASDVAGLNEAKTLQGQKARISTCSGVKVDNARVVKTDVKATNGVIHVIDAVLLPS